MVIWWGQMTQDRPKTDKYSIGTVFVIVQKIKWYKRKEEKSEKNGKNGKVSKSSMRYNKYELFITGPYE